MDIHTLASPTMHGSEFNYIKEASWYWGGIVAVVTIGIWRGKKENTLNSLTIGYVFLSLF